VDRALPIFALAVRPSDHSDENLLRNLSHFQGGDLFTISGVDAGAATAALLASIRVPVLPGLLADLPGTPDPEYANPNPQLLIEGGEALILAKASGRAEDPIAFHLGWGGPESPGSTGGTFEGSTVPVQPLLRREWILLRVHEMLRTLRAHEDPGLVEGLKSFATANRIVTPYTSLLVTIPAAESGAPAGTQAGSYEAGSLFGGLIAAPAAPAAGFSRASSSRGPFSPLEEESRRAEALRRDVSNPILADGEVDRWVSDSSPEGSHIGPAGGVVRFDGTYVRVFEVGDELVGVFREGAFPTPLVANGVGIALALTSVVAGLLVRRRRPE
jgi:hypothetical protein